MKNLFSIIAISTLSLATLSCVKEVELDLEEADRVIVVDGMVSNIAEYNYVKLSMSENFYDSLGFDNVTGATVTISDENGIVYPLLESTPGLYTNALLVGTDYTTYNLNIDIAGEVITASTYLAGNSQLDSIVTAKGGSPFADTNEYTAFAYWADDVNEKNYYRIRSFRNDSLQSNIVVTEDNLFNGLPTGSPLFGTAYYEDNLARIELMEIDAGTYEYWFSLSQISDPQNQPAAPGNPETNLSGNALGYFGAYNIDTMSVVVVE